MVLSDGVYLSFPKAAAVLRKASAYRRPQLLPQPLKRLSRETQDMLNQIGAASAATQEGSSSKLGEPGAENKGESHTNKTLRSPKFDGEGYSMQDQEPALSESLFSGSTIRQHLAKPPTEPETVAQATATVKRSCRNVRSTSSEWGGLPEGRPELLLPSQDYGFHLAFTAVWISPHCGPVGHVQSVAESLIKEDSRATQPLSVGCKPTRRLLGAPGLPVCAPILSPSLPTHFQWHHLHLLHGLSSMGSPL
ncbi:hypothetical protein cyc_02963 [Cyclospora cayetanensis]|uniref:Uncharacterized protein n=1 Tax=Cyclospora cayetanensis TaxID=88456 RepID=A0A1D3DAD5_9EIME|nr:hypothetical protein cyc_02963 [Cyclospora cayetanensis]